MFKKYILLPGLLIVAHLAVDEASLPNKLIMPTSSFLARPEHLKAEVNSRSVWNIFTTFWLCRQAV